MLTESTRRNRSDRIQAGGLPVWQGAGNTRFDRLIASSGVPISYARDVEIYGEGEPSEYFYKVLSGAVRIYRILVDGRRQICTFNMRGEFFGFEAESIHGSSAEAVVNSEVLVIKRSTVMLAAEHDIEVTRQIWSITDAELKRVQAHVLLLIKTAKERVAAFLVEMAARAPDDIEVELPMCRQDIADYIGLTIETVSRMLADLEQRGAISLPNTRRVILRNREALVTHGG
jgi:CRP-like cAMP-binding protein